MLVAKIWLLRPSSCLEAVVEWLGFKLYNTTTPRKDEDCVKIALIGIAVVGMATLDMILFVSSSFE